MIQSETKGPIVDAAELLNLIKNGESDLVELKQSMSDGDKIREAICSFANDLPIGPWWCCDVDPDPGRLLSESIALAEAHAKELGYEPTMDADFAADLREIIHSRKPRPLRMGLILDSSILIAGERRGEGVREILKRVQAAHGKSAIGGTSKDSR
jgi:hypothetical protein